MNSLTEGVETAEQFKFLESIGCDKVQGYYFSKPQPYEEIKKLITSGKLKMPLKA